MKRLIFLLALCFPAIAWSADGDACDAAESGGAPRHCVKLCDTHAAADPPTCTTQNVGRTGQISFWYKSATTCSASLTVTIAHSGSSSGATATLGVLTNVGDALTVTATPLPYIFATISDDTACTDLSVNMYTLP